jgi:3-oxoacyl-[acyl-carrier protein] reductase
MGDLKTFVLTGCASGIGQHLADVLIAHGHCVFATDINFDALQQHAQAQGWPTERAYVRKLDVRDSAAWVNVFQEAVSIFGRVDVLMNIAGYLRPGWIRESALEEVDRHLDINAKGVIFGTLVAARHMIEQRQGHIVNFASMAALAPVPGMALYSASKYAVRAFSLAAAHELRPHGVYVSLVYPDAVQTPMLDLQKNYDEAALTFSAPKVLTVDDVARVVLERVLPRKPLEVFLPARRGWLARFVDTFPGASRLLVPVFQRRGQARQARLRNEERQAQ